METESLDEPAALAFFELNVEEQPATVSELGPWARQFVEASRDCRKSWNSVVCALHPSMSNLAGEILSKLSPKVVRLKGHPVKSGLRCIFALARKQQEFVLDVQGIGPPKASSSRISRTSVRRLRRFGAAANRRSATSGLASSNTAPLRVNKTILRSSALTSFGIQ